MNNQNINVNFDVGIDAAPAFPNLLSDFDNLLTELDHLLTEDDDNQVNQDNARTAYTQLHTAFYEMMAEGGLGPFDEIELENLPENIKNKLEAVYNLVAENEEIFNDENTEWSIIFRRHQDAAWYFYDPNGFDAYIAEVQNQMNQAIAAQQDNVGAQDNLEQQLQAILADADVARQGFPAAAAPNEAEQPMDLQGGKRQVSRTRKARKSSRKARKHSRKAKRSST